jgi:hypothetical protein
MTRLVCALLGLLKWPVALFVAAMTPAGGVAFWALCVEAKGHDTWRSPFGVGFSIAAGVWFLLGRLRLVRFWCTLEHELTHALFAWLTFVPVLELRSTDGSLQSDDDSEGHVRLGGNNWLISIGPYFFPTASAALMAAIWALAAQPTTLARGLLGAATAYSIASTWQETHRHQVDLRQVGFAFCWLFLPGANLLCYGMLLANELGGPERALRYATGAFEVTRRWTGI